MPWSWTPVASGLSLACDTLPILLLRQHNGYATTLKLLTELDPIHTYPFRLRITACSFAPPGFDLPIARTIAEFATANSLSLDCSHDSGTVSADRT